MNRRLIGFLMIGIVLSCLCLLLVYQVPAVKDRADVRLRELQARIKYALNPPEKVVFVPSSQHTGEAALASPQPTGTPFPSPTPEPTQTGTPAPTEPPTLTPTITPTPSPVPPAVTLSGVVHEYQQWNNCGPANLAMALSFWGWKGDQRDTAAYMKPNPRDKNVMPWEMVDFVEQKTTFKAVQRVAGDLETLKRFIAAGFPVIVEKGFEGPKFDGWMGHYEVVTAYDDAKSEFRVQDSYLGPNQPYPYEDLLHNWRAFNYQYIVIYPPERQAEVVSILGAQADPNVNYQLALQKAQDETQILSGRDLYFAWYNVGSSLMNMKDYAAAATAYDAAFANYPNIPEKERPWRMLWYQTGPYFAYYYSQRYQDVIDLATSTLDASNEPILEESYYWRGRARLALGDTQGAIDDFKASIKYHPRFQPSLEQLQLLGVTP